MRAVNDGRFVFIIPELINGNYDIDVLYSGEGKIWCNALTWKFVSMNLEIMNGGEVMSEGILLSQYGSGNGMYYIIVNSYWNSRCVWYSGYLPLMVFECKSCSDYMGDAIHVRQGVKLNSDKFHDFLTVMYW